YVPWFHGDFLRSTQGWTLLERAVYWMLLCSQWENGSIPDDMTRLAAIANTDLATLTSVWPLVGKKFKRTRAGLVNKRMREHRTNFVKYRARLSEAGKKGMQSRWGHRDQNVVDFPGREKPRG